MAEKRRLISQLFPSYLVVILLVAVALGWFADHAVKDFFYSERQADLEARAFLVGRIVQAEDLLQTQVLTELCRRLAESAGMRVTIVSGSGRVLGDSHQDPEVMDNHADRPEIRAAYRGQAGTSVRYSYTLQTEMVYLAIPAVVGSRNIIVRTSVSVSSLQTALSAMRWRIFFATLTIAVAASGISFIVTRQLARPLQAMKRGADRFAQGKFSEKIAVPDTLEFASLAETLNQMASQLDERIRTILTQKSEQEAVLSSMVEGVIALSSKGIIMSLNRAASEMLGIERQQAVGHSMETVVRNSDLVRLYEQTRTSSETGQREIILSTPEERFLQATGTSLKDPAGDIIGSLIVFSDITRLKRLETVRRDFVANVSHELKTPITSIKGFVETLQDGAIHSKDDARKFLTIVSHQTDRLNALVNDLLQLSKIEEMEEESQFELEEWSLRDFLRAAINDLFPAESGEYVSIELDCPPEAKVSVNGPLFHRAVINLLDNAVKYGGAEANVWLEGRSENGWIVVSVRDEGPGIPEKHLPRLFERFYRVDKGRSRELGGTGLGLAIVKHIAQLHGGSASVKSVVGKGSIFSITLPA